MTRKLSKPSPAMLVACIALFVALSGSAVAASIAKNSVGNKQLKRNAVTGSKVKNSSLTGADIKNGKISGSDIRNNSLKGRDILESSLGLVPSASSATTAGHAGSADIATNATNATKATNATNAVNVGGFQIKKIDFNPANGTTSTQFFNEGGLQLSGSCLGGLISITATTTTGGSAIHMTASTLNNVATTNEGKVSSYAEDDSFSVGETFDFQSAGNTLAVDLRDSVQGSFTYASSAGPIITASYMLEENTNYAGRAGDCHMLGTATIG